MATRPLVYCIVPRDLAGKLHEPLREWFSDDNSIEVVVERRLGERRTGSERRETASGTEVQNRRRINNAAGRRVGERRAALIDLEPRELPRKARRHAGRLVFIERLEPSTQELEDLDTARLVTRFQAGERDVLGDIYRRYFDRIYTYIRFALRNPTEAEDLTQRVFMSVMDALERFELRDRPFRAWLFTVARNATTSQLRKDDWTVVTDPHELSRQRDLAAAGACGADGGDLGSLGWISDRDLHLFIERLPEAQRQVLVLKFMGGLTAPEIAEALGLSPDTVRQQLSRALAFLRARLKAVGRAPRRSNRIGGRRLVDQQLVLRCRRFTLLSQPTR